MDKHYLNVVMNEHVVRTRSPSKLDMDNGDTKTYREFRYLELFNNYSKYNTQVSFIPVIGKDYFVLYTAYNTGNSFGYEMNSCCIIHDIYTSAELAYRNLNRLEEWEINRENNKGTSKHIKELEIVLNNRKRMKVNVEWHGYFESLVEHGVKKLTLVK